LAKVSSQNGWSKKSKKIAKKIEEKTEQKTIEKISDKLSDRNALHIEAFDILYQKILDDLKTDTYQVVAGKKNKFPPLKMAFKASKIYLPIKRDIALEKSLFLHNIYYRTLSGSK